METSSPSMTSSHTSVLRQPQTSSSMTFDLSFSVSLTTGVYPGVALSPLDYAFLSLSHKQHFHRLSFDFLSHAVSTLQHLPLAFLSPCLTNTLLSQNFALLSLSPSHFILAKRIYRLSFAHVTTPSVSF